MIKNVADTRFETMSIYALHINALVNFLKRILRNLNNFFKTKECI